MSKNVAMRQKIRSVQTTKKITHAIRLVSMSLYSKVGNQTQKAKEFIDQLNDLFINLLSYHKDWKSTALEAVCKPDADQVWIVIGTTKGLCGALNSNLFKHVSNAVSNENLNKIKFITVGYKATAFVRDTLGGEIICSYNDFNSGNYALIVRDLVTKVAELKICFSVIKLHFMQAKSFFAQKPTTYKLLPLSEELFLANKNSDLSSVDKDLQEIIWEQDKTVVLDFILRRFIIYQVMNIFLQALTSEYTARFIAMDISTNNAEKLLEKLTLQYNKIRQATITREISELAASFTER